MPESDPIAALIVALGTTLMRHCLGRGEAGDAESARLICRQMMQIDGPKAILAVATGGVWAAYRPDGEVDDDSWHDIAAVTRLFLETGGYDGLITLASAALTLMASRDMTDDRSGDLVLAAQGAWEIEHHELALLASRTALADITITARSRAIALMLVARITNDDSDIEVLERDSEGWDDALREEVDIASLVPGPTAATSGGFAEASAAISAGDRMLAAQRLAEETHRLLQAGRDPEALGGLERAFRAMSSDDVDVPALRSGLTGVIRHLRTRQRFGSVPPAVRAALELAIFVLMTDANEAMGSVLVELMEALADAGLSEITIEDADEPPAVIEAKLADHARQFPLWPSLQDCVDGLSGAYALICRNTGGGRTRRSRWLSAFVVPPDGVLIKSNFINADNAATLDALSSNNPERISAISRGELDNLVTGFVPPAAIPLLQNHPGASLVIVPDGPLWSVPWQAAPILQFTTVAVTPSLTVYSRLAEPRRVEHVVALIDDTVDGADLVLDALYAARASGQLSVDFAPAAIGSPCDLLLIVAHGAGSGLRFETVLSGATVNAYEVARRARCDQALIAACLSAKTPPSALPLNLPTSLLMQGCSHCLGGAWPLPQRDTTIFIARVVALLAHGSTLQDSLAGARAAQSDNLFESWGLISTGRIASH